MGIGDLASTTSTLAHTVTSWRARSWVAARAGRVVPRPQNANWWLNMMQSYGAAPAHRVDDVEQQAGHKLEHEPHGADGRKKGKGRKGVSWDRRMPVPIQALRSNGDTTYQTLPHSTGWQDQAHNPKGRTENIRTKPNSYQTV